MTLNPVHARLLFAVAARIVPADEYPSAAEAGAVVYVDRLIDRDLPHRRAELIAGLAALDAAARSAYASGFTELTPDRQDAVLTHHEGSPDPAERSFFAWLTEMVLESYYADPANGGNAGGVSWRMVGYDPKVPGYDGDQTHEARHD